jgi:hypothetical protein
MGRLRLANAPAPDSVGTLARFADDRYLVAASPDASLLRRDETPPSRSPVVEASPLALFLFVKTNT